MINASTRDARVKQIQSVDKNKSMSSGQINLDTYMDNVFENQLKFSVEKKVVNQIQNGVEKIVEDLLNFVTSDKEVLNDIEELKDTFGNDIFIDDFTPEKLGVGSFYEGTKNTFPDEFDFVFIILCARKPLFTRTFVENCSMFNNILFKTIIWRLGKHVTKCKKYYAEQLSDSFCSFQLLDATWAEGNGPNITLHLKFEYRKQNKHYSKDIDVDITPAIKVIDSNACISKYLRIICSSEEFGREVKHFGSFLVILRYSFTFTNISFTGTELHFMQHILSNRHKKVYRLLKYLIHGRLSEKEIKELCRHPAITLHKSEERKHWISSYEIKTIIIFHHYRCTKSAASPVYPCVIKLLKWIDRRLSRYSVVGDMCRVNLKPLVLLDSTRMTRWRDLFLVEEGHIVELRKGLSDLINELLKHERNKTKCAIKPWAERYVRFLHQLRLDREKYYGQETIHKIIHMRGKLTLEEDHNDPSLSATLIVAVGLEKFALCDDIHDTKVSRNLQKYTRSQMIFLSLAILLIFMPVFVM